MIHDEEQVDHENDVGCGTVGGPWRRKTAAADRVPSCPADKRAKIGDENGPRRRARTRKQYEL